MDRRDFVKLAGFTGLSVFLPSVLGNEAAADEATWGGPYFLQMHAAGGWDPTMFCDAKLTAGGTTPVYENKLITAVTDINGISVPTATAAGKFLLRNNGDAIEDPEQFFRTVGKDFLVINGVDTQTNNHDTGVQGLACGHNDVELPALAALFAGYVAKQRNVPMAFLAGGQYNRTGDVVGVSRFPGNKIGNLADPFRAAPNDKNALLSDLAVRRIMELRGERMSRLEALASLPRNKRTLLATRDANKGGASVNLLKSVAGAAAPDIATFADQLPEAAKAFLTAAQGNNPPRFVDFGRPLETILKCFQAGVSASATFAQGGFDTHSNHDVDQGNAMAVFVSRLRYTLLRAEQLGIRDKLYIMVTSDFGRTPRYNTGNGKDHWNVTSSLVFGPGIRGGRAVGKTDAGHKAMRVASGNVGQIVDDKDPNGMRIHASHIHRELRRLLGVEQADFIGQFPLPAADGTLPLFA